MDSVFAKELNLISSAMAETNKLVPETDITALEEALYAQQQLLQKLNNELDVERESAATAASEALSMILRLQGEKASLKMEASQYKRMAEEKMCHAEEALAIFEDLIYQREMEIVSLEFQVQAYRYKLISMGFNDLGVCEFKFPENLLMQRNDNSNVRRLNSLPHVSTKDSKNKKSTIDRKKSVNSAQDSIPGGAEDNSKQENDDPEKKLLSCVSVDLNSYWDQIKKLDERMKELSDSKDCGRNKSTLLKGVTWSPTLLSQVASIDPTTEDKQAIASSACSSSVQDIFEVPQTTVNRKSFESWKKEVRKLNLEFENRFGKPDLFTDETTESSGKYESDRAKAISISTSNEKKLTKPRGVMSVVQQPVGVGNMSSAEYQQLCRRIERLERARNNARQEIVAEGEEEMKLLKEICEQLKSIESEMRSMRAKKSIFPLEPSLDPLQQAMIYFWM